MQNSENQKGRLEGNQPLTRKIGDTVSLRRKMLGLRGAELVEGSDTLFSHEPALVVMGDRLRGTVEIRAEVHDTHVAIAWLTKHK